VSEQKKRDAASLPKLYAELASWWPLVSAPEDYAEEADFLHRELLAATERAPRTLLELGSGGGNLASHLKSHFETTLLDRSPGMLDVSRKLNPECEHLQGDMRSVRLGRLFDVVLVHDAVMYMTTDEDLRQAIETCYIHLRPGGVAVLLPDYVRETFRPTTQHGGHDGEERGLRYLEWAWDPDPSGATFVVEYAYVLRDADGSVRVEYDRHREGLFGRARWSELLRATGFAPRILRDPWNRDVFVAAKPDSRRG
jgi:SAM-dependent methyltransferase